MGSLQVFRQNFEKKLWQQARCFPKFNTYVRRLGFSPPSNTEMITTNQCGLETKEPYVYILLAMSLNTSLNYLILQRRKVEIIQGPSTSKGDALFFLIQRVDRPIDPMPIRYKIFETLDISTNNYYMVIQYANGGSLRQYLQRNHQQLTWNDKIRIVNEIATGLYAIHQENLSHKNLHPNNILIHDGRTMISDVGYSDIWNSVSISEMITFLEP
ncbi:2107_t:CDS:2, partial [Entrophospora sp. SA101]